MAKKKKNNKQDAHGYGQVSSSIATTTATIKATMSSTLDTDEATRPTPMTMTTTRPSTTTKLMDQFEQQQQQGDIIMNITTKEEVLLTTTTTTRSCKKPKVKQQQKHKQKQWEIKFHIIMDRLIPRIGLRDTQCQYHCCTIIPHGNYNQFCCWSLRWIL